MNEARDGRPMILVVEDDRDVREAIVEALEDHEYLVHGAGNGADALEQLRTTPRKPCLILLDIMMPIMDGWQFRGVQQADAELSSIPVVVFTAHTSARQVAETMQAAGFLKKPVQLADLISTVSHFCK